MHLDHNPSLSIRAPESAIPDVPFPMDDEMWDQPPEFLDSATAPVGTARNLAIAAQLLGCVISHIHDASKADDKKHRALELNREIVSFVLTTTENSIKAWGANCGALGLGYGSVALP